MKTLQDYQEQHEAGEYIEDLFTTTVGELENFEHGWDFQGWEDDYAIKINITNRSGKLEAFWMDDFDSSVLDIDVAIETINELDLR